MNIFFDTCAIQASSIRLTSPDLLTVWRMAMREDVNIYTSDIVIEELVNHFRGQLRTQVTRAESALKQLNAFHDTGFRVYRGDGQWDQRVEAYRNSLVDKFHHTGGLICQVPTVDHNQLVKRVLAKGRPFAAGNDGYKDMMIWMSAVEVARLKEEPVLFVSGNTTDFGENIDGKWVLHSDFSSDLVLAGMESDSILLVASIDELVKEYLAPDIGELEDVESQVKNMTWSELTLPNDLEHILETELEREMVNWPWQDYWVEQGLLHVEQVTEVLISEIESARVVRVENGFHMNLEVFGDMGIDIEAESDTYLGDKLDDDDHERRFVRSGRLIRAFQARISLLFDSHWQIEAQSAQLIHA